MASGIKSQREPSTRSSRFIFDVISRGKGIEFRVELQVFLHGHNRTNLLTLLTQVKQLAKLAFTPRSQRSALIWSNIRVLNGMPVSMSDIFRCSGLFRLRGKG